eukprot:gb/GEZJ01000499.1/.p1 GENE.gb/GEZJ01000499.1/~~gb/GEZJ01000499.1/.p1  ORF type:complete len:102 (+),score=10.11 gb/GEZJ01000499.1/:1130-1435(+)
MAAAVARQGPIYTRIIQKLTASLRPLSLQLKDESHLHAGHKESPGLPETHFNLEIVSDVFEGMPLLQRQRKVYSILSEELRDRVHALSMKTKAPSECSGGS